MVQWFSFNNVDRDSRRSPGEGGVKQSWLSSLASPTGGQDAGGDGRGGDGVDKAKEDEMCVANGKKVKRMIFWKAELGTFGIF